MADTVREVTVDFIEPTERTVILDMMDGMGEFKLDENGKIIGYEFDNFHDSNEN